MTDTGYTIMVEGLRKRFDGPDGEPFDALDNVSFKVRSDSLTAFVGPDGAGKTTLMRMLAGLLSPDEGSIEVLGIDVRRDPQSVQDRISYMPQRFGLYEDLSVQENLDLYADLHGVPPDVRRTRFARLMEMTDLGRFTARPAGKLSGGMKQKLGLACTLVRSPDLLLLDEPSVGVDPLSRRDLWVIIEQLIADEHLSVIVSTAYMDEAARCAEVFVFNRGTLLADGSPADLCKVADGLTYTVDPAEGESARLLQSQLIGQADRIIDAVPKGGHVDFIRRQRCTDEAIAALLPGRRIAPRPAGLEDSFMVLLRRQEAERAPNAPHVPAPDEAVPVQPKVSRVSATAEADAKPVIVVRDLVRKFGDFTAVANTSFDVRKGEIFGLLGPNGAGKTTTFRMLCGLLPATSGQLEVAGHDLRKARAKARTRIGYVAQKFALYSNLSVQENLQFFAGAYGLRGDRATDRIETVIAQFSLDPKAQSGALPTGYKQRLAMAAGLLHEPEILFLDEPTSGIDPLARRTFWQTITGLARIGVTIVVTTHFMEEAEFCDRIFIQDAGGMLALGTPREVREMAGGKVRDMNEAFIEIVEQARRHAQSAQAAA